jgi:hypothetical protein
LESSSLEVQLVAFVLEVVQVSKEVLVRRPLLCEGFRIGDPLKKDVEGDSTVRVVFVRAHAPTLFMVFALHILDVGLEPFNDFGFEAACITMPNPIGVIERKVILNQILPVLRWTIVITLPILNHINRQDDTAVVVPTPIGVRAPAVVLKEGHHRSVLVIGMALALARAFANLVEFLGQPRESHRQEHGDADTEKPSVNTCNHGIHYAMRVCFVNV